MAQRRMISLQVVDTDAFLEMPATSQLLYFHLAVRADDDGFVANPRKIMRSVSAQEDDLKVLVAKRFIIMFESGVVVIKHWRIHNYIQSDRYHETSYLTEKKMLILKENGSYSEKNTPCIQNVSKMETEVRLGKVRLGKDKDNAAAVATAPLKGKKPKREDYPMSLTEFVEWCKKSTQRHIQIIGEWADTIKPNRTTRFQWDEFMSRHFRAAKSISAFSQEQIERAYTRVEQEHGKGWLNRYTLETLLKFID